MTMHVTKIVGLILTVAVLGGCDDTTRSTSASTQVSEADPSADVCAHLRAVKTLAGDLSQGTVTHDEAVASLTDLQVAFESDAKILKDQGAPRAPLVGNVGIGLGQLKVTVDNAGTSFGASSSVTAALLDLADDIKAMGPC